VVVGGMVVVVGGAVVLVGGIVVGAVEVGGAVVVSAGSPQLLSTKLNTRIRTNGISTSFFIFSSYNFRVGAPPWYLPLCCLLVVLYYLKPFRIYVNWVNCEASPEKRT
jgi:hypothetical protein